jgi:formate hydrogenlyase subunit 6/NADH:ubiquinone oxidoreductase subunit I/flavodoxin
MAGTIIHYYSGTGNSLHVARELKRRLPESCLQSILSVLKDKAPALDADTIGLVFPVYLNSIPGPVRSFIRKIKALPVKYFFAVTTNCGYPGKVDYLTFSMLKSNGLSLNYYASLKMLSNNPTGLMPAILANKKWMEIAGEDKAAEILPKIHKELDQIAGEIKNRVSNIKPGYKPNLVRRTLLAVTEHLSPIDTTRSIPFFVDQDCNSCGTCEKVCLSGKIVMSGNKPEWLEYTQCYFCYACFNYCPQQAILVKGYNYKTGRYSHPGIRATDIAEQKD